MELKSLVVEPRKSVMATDSIEATSDSNQRRSGRLRVLTVKVREDQESKAVAKAAAAVPTRTIYKPKKKSAGPRFQFNPANRRNTQEAERNCDFTCHISVNKWYPTYKGRGQFNCPFSLMILKQGQGCVSSWMARTVAKSTKE